jgi:hypothetical protein
VEDDTTCGVTVVPLPSDAVPAPPDTPAALVKTVIVEILCRLLSWSPGLAIALAKVVTWCWAGFRRA